MRPSVTTALAFFLGLTLSIGFYEGRRLVRNTSKALTAATLQISGKVRPPEPAEDEPAKKTKNTKKPKLDPDKAERLQTAVKKEAKKRKETSQKRADIKKQLDEMTPEERQAVLANRLDRKAQAATQRQERLSERLAATRTPELPGTAEDDPLDTGELPLEDR